jgi:LacI family transcriptional regulator
VVKQAGNDNRFQIQTRRAATLHDVASAAKVSVSTASRALNGVSNVSKATVARVNRAALELSYHPNGIARSLKTRSSRLIGLVLHNLVNVSFHTVAEVAQTRLGLAGYQVILCITGDDPEREAHYLEMLAHHQVEGILVVGTGRNPNLLRRLAGSGLPMIELIRETPGVPLNTVLAGDTLGAYEATRYLIRLGHRRVGLIAGPEHVTSGRERSFGYIQALAKAKIPIDPQLIFRGPFTPGTGTNGAAALLELPTPPTAILISNHESVFGVLPILVERKIRIPDQLSIICYEDVPWFSWWSPPLTVVDSNPAELANVAVDLLLKQIRRESGLSVSAPQRHEYRVGARLITRQSCARPINASGAPPVRRALGSGQSVSPRTSRLPRLKNPTHSRLLGGR